MLFISKAANENAGLLQKSGVDSEELLGIFYMLSSYFVDRLGVLCFVPFGVCRL